MGSCISKCRSKKKYSEEEDCDYVQDKLVISQAQVSPLPPPPITKKYSLPPSSPPSSTSSTSCTTSSSYSLTSSSSSSSSCSSSILSLKDRSFSNEFLWSCAKDNPHIMLIDKSAPTKVHVAKLAPVKQSIPQRPVRATPQKRARASSPTLTRQKSFRKEPEKPNSPYSVSSRTLRSPSPSRRFSTGENCKGVLSNSPKESLGTRSIGSKVSKVSSEASSCVRKETVRPVSPSNNTISTRHCSCSRNREKCTIQIGSKVDEIAVEEVVSNADVDQAIPTEDINNPLIALDCFIFL
ncbi:A-agglutinin anchorage subunit [Cornus florida]|uniref:A-agglutinin anchorage subunit n=1 Tax=Cornus florida TaxID=4283 RepID=UPI002898C0AE|nr:A-agglutinin anchorage subunit [Cornus florida]